MMSEIKITELDLYEILGISIEASESEIKKAYRKKALICHPDKNQGNPNAAALFLQLSEALKILTDTAARSAYDKVLRAKQAAKLRHREFDSKRKKLKDDLEAREEAARLSRTKGKTDEEVLQAEIERLRKEGQQLLKDELCEISELLLKELKRPKTVVKEDGRNFKIKLSWKSSPGGGDDMYTEENLRRILHKYGDIVDLVVSSKRRSALVEYASSESAKLAFQLERGFILNPLTLKWVDKKKQVPQRDDKRWGESSLITERDYESMVLRTVRQAEERKRLIQQMQNDDDDDDGN